MASVLVMLGLLTFAIACHPFITYPVSLFFVRERDRLRLTPAAPSVRPSLALCLSAFNEEKVIVAKAENMLEMARRYGPATIHIYVDGSTDGTAALLAPYADRIDLVVSDARSGKTAGINTLVARSQSEFVAFTDANVVTSADGLIGLSAALADPTIGCTTAKLVYSNEKESPTSSAGSFYWRAEEALKRIESLTVGVIGVDGAFFMMRRRFYEPAPPNLIDDLYVSLIVLMRGARVVTVDDVIVRERSATHWREEFVRKRRIACQAMNVHRMLWPRLRAMKPLTLYAYVSHRLMKWLSPFVLLLAALLLTAGFMVRFGALPIAVIWAALGALLAIGGALGIAPAPLFLTSATSLLGVALGVLQSLLSKEAYVTWQPAPSVRDAD